MILTDILKALKSEIEDIVKDIKLQKEETEEEPEYVKPYVQICHTPHKNFLPLGYQVPYIMICFDEGEDDGTDNYHSIRLNFATYGGGFYKNEHGEEVMIPDALGYINLLDLMEKVKGELIKRSFIGNTVIDLPYTHGIYEGNPWPYWYGNALFKVRGLVDETILPDSILEGGL